MAEVILSDVSKRFGRVAAATRMSLAVGDGELVVLLGPTGAGKTTLMLALTGHVRRFGGDVRWAGASFAHVAPSDRVPLGLGWVPQERDIFASLTVEENLLTGGYTRRDGRAVARDLEMVYSYFPRLRERRSVGAGYVSGGEQQMVAIGRALMAHPKLMLLDEPSMGLAPVMVLRLFDLIRRVRQEGYTILVVEQNVRQILKLVDRAYLLEVGRIKMEGHAAALAEQDFVRKAYVGL